MGGGGGGGGGGKGSSSTVRIIGKEVVLLKFCFLVLEVWVFKFQGPRILGERERFLLGCKPFSISTRRFSPF